MLANVINANQKLVPISFFFSNVFPGKIAFPAFSPRFLFSADREQVTLSLPKIRWYARRIVPYFLVPSIDGFDILFPTRDNSRGEKTR